LIPSFPHFNFEHGCGLGVLAVGKDQPEAVTNFLQTANANASTTRELFSCLGGKLLGKLLPETDEEVQNLRAQIQGMQGSRPYRLGRGLLAPARLLRKLWRCFH
jgi:hypothetical protein